MSDKKKLVKFIKEEITKLHRIDLLENKKKKIEGILKEGNYEDMTEIFGFSKKGKEDKQKKAQFIEVINEINNLTEDEVGYFSKSTDNISQSIRYALNTIKEVIPKFYELLPQLFDEDQVGVEIFNENDPNSNFPLVVPSNFKKICKPYGNGELTVDLESIKKGLKKIVNSELYTSSYGELY